MRIAMFADCYHPVINGVTTSIEILVRALEGEGHEVLLFVPDAPEATDDRHVRRFASVTFPLQPEERFCFPWPVRHFRALRDFRPEVVHLHTPFNVGFFGWFAAQRLGVPRVFTHHTLWEEYVHYFPLVPPWLMKPFAVALCRWFCNTSGAVIAPSDEVRDRQLEQGVRSPIHVVPTGIELDRFDGGDPAGPRRELGLTGEERLLLYIGRVGREKSLDFLLQAFSRAASRDARLRLAVIGDGPERPALEALASRLDLGARARFLGYRRRDDLKHFLAASRGFLFASQTETQGLVLLEAQAGGVPVVGVRASGTNEAVADGRSGLLVDPGDLEGFASAALRLATDDDLQARLGRGALEWVEGFSMHTMAARALEVYRVAGAR